MVIIKRIDIILQPGHLRYHTIAAYSFRFHRIQRFATREVSIKGQVSKIYKTVSAYVSIASEFYLSLWMK